MSTKKNTLYLAKFPRKIRMSRAAVCRVTEKKHGTPPDSPDSLSCFLQTPDSRLFFPQSAKKKRSTVLQYHQLLLYWYLLTVPPYSHPARTFSLSKSSSPNPETVYGIEQTAYNQPKNFLGGDSLTPLWRTCEVPCGPRAPPCARTYGTYFTYGPQNQKP